MNEERKDEIGRRFLLNAEFPVEECGELAIQELIFLIHSARYFKEKGAFDAGHLEERGQALFRILKERITEAESLYIAYDKHTSYPYIDRDDRIWLFSTKEFAARAEDYFLQQLLMLEMKLIPREDISRTIAGLHILGIRNILIDNGQYTVELDRDEIVPPPDWTAAPQINIPVSNPQLQHAMLRFFQENYSRQQYEGKQRQLQMAEARMLDALVEAKFLVPMQLKEEAPALPDDQGVKTLKQGTVIQFAVLGAEGEESWLPVFTDWPEFEKAYDKTVWGGNVAGFEDILTISERMSGAVINFKGVGLRLDEKNKKMIAEYIRERGTAGEEQHVQETTEPQGTRILLGEPKEYPKDMIQAVKAFMKTQKGIKKAYLRLMVKNNEQSYLLIIDLEGNREEVFNGIAKAVAPYRNGMPVDMVDWHGWHNEIKDVAPFYTKKRFGLF